MLKIPHIFKFISLLGFFTLSSCVKDVDIDQAEEIFIPPEVAVDLVYSTLSPSHFSNSVPSAPLVVSDTTRLDFLDDDYIKNSLVRAELNFKYTNTFPQAFTSTISFLSENNSKKYSFEIQIPAGSAASPQIVDHIEIIEGSAIKAIRKSIKLSIKVEMHPNTSPVSGELQLKSKGFFKFEFK
ncbi:MAG TPA: hypothetical protein VFM59_07530 [Salinimicrobium sp.]|nr:hypothetical protein [Salinimicrobium sp.]